APNMQAAAMLTRNPMASSRLFSCPPKRSWSAPLGGLHMALLQERDRLRRGHEFHQLARQILLLGGGHQPDIERARLVGEARQRADIVRGRDADQRAVLREATL